MRENLRVSLVVVLVSSLAVGFLQLFNGFYYQRDFDKVMAGLPVFLVVVVILMIGTVVAILQVLGPLMELHKHDPHEQGAEDYRARALSSLRRLPLVVFGVNILGFFVGPIITMLVRAGMGTQALEPMDLILYTILSSVIGILAALQELIAIDGITGALRRSWELGLHDLGAKGHESLRMRLNLTMFAAVLFASVLSAMAAMGHYREQARWTQGVLMGSQGADATTAASEGAPPGGPTAEVLGTLFSNESIHVEELRVTLELTILVFIVLGWTGFLTLATTSSLAKRIAYLDGRLKDLSNGSGDLAGRIAIDSSDELGAMANSFNKVMDKISGLVVQTLEAGSTVEEASGNLKTISDNADDTLGAVTMAQQNLKSAIEAQASVVLESERTARHLSELMGQVQREIQGQEFAVSGSSSSISEIVSNIASVARMTDQSEEVANKLGSAAKEGSRTMADLVSAMAEVEVSARQVGSIAGSMAKIAAQTNLLAMNAAIEAAHAGAAGQGFAVVASEVRKLAESASLAARDVATTIKGMVQKLERGVKLTETSEELYSEINGSIQSNSDLIRTIAAAMSEQREGAELILQSIVTLVESTNKVSGLSGQQMQQSEVIAREMGIFNESHHEISKALEVQRTSMNVLQGLMVQVVEESTKTSQASRELKARAGSFSAI